MLSWSIDVKRLELRTQRTGREMTREAMGVMIVLAVKMGGKSMAKFLILCS